MKKENMSLLDAFIALEDLEDEEIQMPLNEGKAFKLRDTVDMEKAKDFLEEQGTKEVSLEVIDVDADSLEHLKKNEEYVGQMILKCKSCIATRFINAEDLVESESEKGVYNVEDECPHCHKSGIGFILLGQVGQVKEEDDASFENDSLTDETKFENDFEETPAEEEPVEETKPEEDEEEFKETEEDIMETSAEDDTADMESTLGDEFNPDNELKSEEEGSEESLTKDEEEKEYDEPLTEIEPEEEEDKKKEKKESLEEAFEAESKTVSELFDSVVEPENIETVIIYDLDSNDPEEEIFRGSFEDIPTELFDAELIEFSVGLGTLIINIDTAAEIDELTETVKDILEGFGDEFNDKISVWDQETGEEVFVGTKQSVLEQFGHNAFLSLEAPEMIELKLRGVEIQESLKTPYKESLDLSDPEEKLIYDIIMENRLKEYNVGKYGTEEYWIADSIRNLEDLDNIWNEYILNKSESLRKEFQDVTGFGIEEDEEIEEALEGDAEEKLIEKAREALKASGDYAVIYAYVKGGKVYELPELVFAKDAESLKDKTEIVQLRYRPTGSIRVLYNHDVNEEFDYKNRKDLSEAILECEKEGIVYRIKRSVKEGYRYTLVKENVNKKPLAEDEVEQEVIDTAENAPAEVEETTTAVIDPRDAELVEKLTRIAHDTAEAIREAYGVEVDERVILADMIQDLQLVSGQVSPEELADTPMNQLTKQMFNAYNGFYAALDELVSFVTGQPITTTTAQKIQQAIDSLDSEEFSTEVIKEKIQSPQFLLALQQGNLPGITYEGDPSEIRLLTAPEEVEEDLTIKVSPEEVVVNDGEEDVAVIPNEGSEEKEEKSFQELVDDPENPDVTENEDGTKTIEGDTMLKAFEQGINVETGEVAEPEELKKEEVEEEVCPVCGKHPCECLHEDKKETLYSIEYISDYGDENDKYYPNLKFEVVKSGNDQASEIKMKVTGTKEELEKFIKEHNESINSLVADGSIDKDCLRWLANVEDIKVVESLEEAKEEELPADPEVVKADVHSTIADLVKDEVEAIDAYEEAKAEIADTHIEHKDDIIDTIDHIEDEEKEHVDELVDAAVEIPFDKEESKEETVEETPVKEEPKPEEEIIPEEEPIEFDETKFESFVNEWFDNNVEETKLFECLTGGIKEDGTIVLEGKLHLEEDKDEDVSFELTPIKEEMNEELLDSKHVSTYTITSTSLPENLTYTLDK